MCLCVYINKNIIYFEIPCVTPPLRFRSHCLRMAYSRPSTVLSPGFNRSSRRRCHRKRLLLKVPSKLALFRATFSSWWLTWIATRSLLSRLGFLIQPVNMAENRYKKWSKTDYKAICFNHRRRCFEVSGSRGKENKTTQRKTQTDRSVNDDISGLLRRPKSEAANFYSHYIFLT